MNTSPCAKPSALDASIRAQILNLLKDLRYALDPTVLFISHALTVARQMRGRIIVIHDLNPSNWTIFG
jgi:peptide/nickel transport system ATP-binding protein